MSELLMIKISVMAVKLRACNERLIKDVISLVRTQTEYFRITHFLNIAIMKLSVVTVNIKINKFKYNTFLRYSTSFQLFLSRN